MDELQNLIKETNEQLREINYNLKIRYNKDKVYKITEGDEVKTFDNNEDTVLYLNDKYKTNIKTNSLKNLTKLNNVKTNSKYKKIFGDKFRFEII